MSAGLFFTSAFRLKKAWAWLLAPVLTLLVMCSRMYLGVHYPTDVLAGAALGIAFSCLWEFIYRKFPRLRDPAAALFAVNIAGLATGIQLSVNRWSLGAGALLGVPGVISMLVLDIVFK